MSYRRKSAAVAGFRFGVSARRRGSYGTHSNTVLIPNRSIPERTPHSSGQQPVPAGLGGDTDCQFNPLLLARLRRTFRLWPGPRTTAPLKPHSSGCVDAGVAGDSGLHRFDRLDANLHPGFTFPHLRLVGRLLRHSLLVSARPGDGPGSGTPACILIRFSSCSRPQRRGHHGRYGLLAAI